MEAFLIITFALLLIFIVSKVNTFNIRRKVESYTVMSLDHILINYDGKTALGISTSNHSIVYFTKEDIYVVSSNSIRSCDINVQLEQTSKTPIIGATSRYLVGNFIGGEFLGSTLAMTAKNKMFESIKEVDLFITTNDLLLPSFSIILSRNTNLKQKKNDFERLRHAKSLIDIL